jgi:hypothetical protein
LLVFTSFPVRSFSAYLDFPPRLIASSLQGVWIIGYPFYSDSNISSICTTTLYPSLIPWYHFSALLSGYWQPCPSAPGLVTLIPHNSYTRWPYQFIDTYSKPESSGLLTRSLRNIPSVRNRGWSLYWRK